MASCTRRSAPVVTSEMNHVLLALGSALTNELYVLLYSKANFIFTVYNYSSSDACQSSLSARHELEVFPTRRTRPQFVSWVKGVLSAAAFSCPKCGWGFNRQSDLQRHLVAGCPGGTSPLEYTY